MSNKKSITMVVDHASKALYPQNVDEFNYILQFFEDKSKVTLTIEPLIRKVEKSQMGLLHAYIKYIHDETGEDKDRIKVLMKEKYGVRNEDGSLKSTANYTTTEMNALIEGLYIFMTQELEMVMPTPDEWKKTNLK